MPLISFIMAVYNNERYLPYAVHSVTDQGFDDYELIIVDDGSTDETGIIADKLSAENDHIRVIHQDNQWIYASYNNGVSVSRGEYIYILNSDDKLGKGCLRYLADKIEQYNHPDVVWTFVINHECDNDQTILRSYSNNRYPGDIYERYYEDVKAVRYNWNFYYKTCLSMDAANLYRREIAIKHPFRNDNFSGDVLFNIAIADDVRNCLVLKDPIYHFYIYTYGKGNASLGKYYGNEHEMFNLRYTELRDLYRKWRIPSRLYEDFLKDERIELLDYEIKKLYSPACDLDAEGKLMKIFGEMYDDVIRECIRDGDGERIESRLLFESKRILSEDKLPARSEMSFVPRMLEALLRFDKDNDDIEAIKESVNSEKNPFCIGKSFLNRLKYGQYDYL